MIGHLLLLCAISDTSAVSGEQVIATVKRMLAKFDVPGPYRLASLSHSERTYMGNSWSVTLTSKDGDQFRGNVDALTGEVRFLMRDRPYLNEKPPVSNRTLASKWLARIGPTLPTRIDPSGRLDPRQIVFQVLVHGYPFVAPEHLGYSFVLRKGAFSAYEAPPKLPSFGLATAALKARDALNVLNSIYQTDLVPNVRGHKWRVTSFKPGKCELGWAWPEREPRAVMAWRVTYTMTIDPGGSIVSASPPRATEGTVLIDANTGKRIKAR